MTLVISWIIVSLLFAFAGTNRKIGFSRSLLVCLILSPLIGLVVILLSEKHSETLIKLKISNESKSISDEEYNRRVREIVPNAEDKADMRRGTIIFVVIALIIYLFVKYL